MGRAHRGTSAPMLQLIGIRLEQRQRRNLMQEGVFGHLSGVEIDGGASAQ